ARRKRALRGRGTAPAAARARRASNKRARSIEILDAPHARLALELDLVTLWNFHHRAVAADFDFERLRILEPFDQRIQIAVEHAARLVREHADQRSVAAPRERAP